MYDMGEYWIMQSHILYDPLFSHVIQYYIIMDV